MRNSATLRQLLRSLCHKTQWFYAVFWKLKQETEMILTWEDGYFDEAKERSKLEETLYDGSLHINPGMISFVDSKDAQDQSCSSHPIKMALANMKFHHYSVGEGFVGKVALTQGHYWIFADELKSKIQSDPCEDWQLQLAAEVKTILLVPVAHYGVVQLGSLEMVMEDLTLVFHIKDLFCALYHDLGTHESLDSSIDCSNISSPINDPLLANISSSILSAYNSAQSQQLLTNDPNILSFFMVDHLSPFSQNVMDQILDIDTIPDADENAIEAMCNYLWAEGNSSEFCYTKNETKISAQRDPLDCISIIAQEHRGCDLSVKDVTCKETEKNYTSKTNSLIDGRFCSFPIESELHRPLAMTSVEEYDDCFFNTTLTIDDRSISSITAFQTMGSEYHDHTFSEANAWRTKGSDTEHLLDAVASSLHCGSDDDIFAENFFGSFGSNSSEELFDSSLRESKSGSSVLDLGNLSPQSQQRCTSLSKAEGFKNSPTNSSCKSICQSTIEDNDSHKAKKHYSRKLPVINKRGGRNGNSHKPRPRDRQLIQDRVKELRELIPNGSKCSIDTLLDKTVSHMLFLQSISSQAEKLKRTAHPEVKGEVHNSGKPPTQANEASSACGRGCQPDNWPIVVENLDQPGQILVEVLCNDYGLFLEIAHIIRRLELTILKGVLESRSDELWAHFVIEASRGFHRTHILWPLMQLLQRNYAPVPSNI